MIVISALIDSWLYHEGTSNSWLASCNRKFRLIGAVESWIFQLALQILAATVSFLKFD